MPGEESPLNTNTGGDQATEHLARAAYEIVKNTRLTAQEKMARLKTILGIMDEDKSAETEESRRPRRPKFRSEQEKADYLAHLEWQVTRPSIKNGAELAEWLRDEPAGCQVPRQRVKSRAAPRFTESRGKITVPESVRRGDSGALAAWLESDHG